MSLVSSGPGPPVVTAVGWSFGRPRHGSATRLWAPPRNGMQPCIAALHVSWRLGCLSALSLTGASLKGWHIPAGGCATALLIPMFFSLVFPLWVSSLFAFWLASSHARLGQTSRAPYGVLYGGQGSFRYMAFCAVCLQSLHSSRVAFQCLQWLQWFSVVFTVELAAAPCKTRPWKARRPGHLCHLFHQRRATGGQ